MENFRIYDGVCVGDIYHHDVEGVCILSDVTDYHLWFTAVDIDAKYPSNQDTPREFKTQILSALERPKISLKITAAPFKIGAIVYWVAGAQCHWGYCKENLTDHVMIEKEEKLFKVHKAQCFQVEKNGELTKSVSHLQIAI